MSPCGAWLILSICWMQQAPWPTLRKYIYSNLDPVEPGSTWSIGLHKDRHECDWVPTLQVSTSILVLGAIFQSQGCLCFPAVPPRSLMKYAHSQCPLFNNMWVEVCAGTGAFKIVLERAGRKVRRSMEIERHLCGMFSFLHESSEILSINMCDLNLAPMFYDVSAWCGSPLGNQKGFEDDHALPLLFLLLLAALFRPQIILLENVPKLVRLEKHAGIFREICTR